MKLVSQYGSIEAALDAAGEQKGALRERLTVHREQALFSKWLATIDRNAPLPFDLDACAIGDWSGALPILKRLQLRQAVDKLVKLFGAAKPAQAPIVPPLEAPVEVGAADAIARMAHGAPPGVGGRFFGRRTVRGGRRRPPREDHVGRRPHHRRGSGRRTRSRRSRPCFKLDAPLIAYDVKKLFRLGAPVPDDAYDVLLAGYVLNPQANSLAMPALFARRGRRVRRGVPRRVAQGNSRRSDGANERRRLDGAVPRRRNAARAGAGWHGEGRIPDR